MVGIALDGVVVVVEEENLMGLCAPLLLSDSLGLINTVDSISSSSSSSCLCSTNGARGANKGGGSGPDDAVGIVLNDGGI